MKVKDLVFKFEEEAIIKRLIELYPDQEESEKGYRGVLKELKTLSPVPSEFKIDISKEIDEENYTYYHVCAIDKNNKLWAIDFTDWEEWLSMKLSPATLKACSLLDTLCHCLWEMTFCGFSNKEIKLKKQELFDRIKDIKKEPEDEV